MNNINKLNACIALMALQSVDEFSGLEPEDRNRVVELTKHLEKTAVMQEINSEDEVVTSALNTSLTEHAISLIEEYLKEQGI